MGNSARFARIIKNQPDLKLQIYPDKDFLSQENKETPFPFFNIELLLLTFEIL